MNKLLSIAFALILPLYAYADNSVEEFHRLLVFNQQEELMVVKIKDTDFWVTPGLYSQDQESTNKALHKLAAEYNLKLNELQLRGVFSLTNKQSQKTSNRYFYYAKTSDLNYKLPENIEKIEWLPINKAMELITFPHINILLKQVIDYPDQIWSADILRYKEGDKFKAKITKEFSTKSKTIK